MVDLAGAGRTVLLSSHQIGEVERVASHVALLHKGKLILAEPPTELRGRACGDLASTGRTVLLSSHQIGEVERVASHVALLHTGKLILAESLDELRAKTFLLVLTFTSRDHPEAPPRTWRWS